MTVAAEFVSEELPILVTVFEAPLMVLPVIVCVFDAVVRAETAIPESLSVVVPVACGRLPLTMLEVVDTLPPTTGIAHVPSPRQNVEAEAPVPLFKLPTARLPVTPEDRLTDGMRAAAKTPVLISDASILLFVNVCVSEVPTMIPAGAATAVVTLGAVRTTTPLEPGSAKPLLLPLPEPEA